MTATEIAARYIAGLYRDLSIDRLVELRSDDGIAVYVDLELGTAHLTAMSDDAVPVAVWHRDDDDMIVASTDTEYPEDGEEWFELPAPQSTLYLVLDAEDDLAQASALDGFHDLDSEARASLIAAYEDAYVSVAKRLYGRQVDLLIGGADADPGEVHRHLSRNVNQDAAREAWQAIHDEIDLRELHDRVDLTDGLHVHEQIMTAPALAFGVCDPAYGDPEVWIVKRDGTGSDAFDGEPFASRAWKIDGVDGLDVIVDELGHEPVPGATWETTGDFTTLAVRPY